MDKKRLIYANELLKDARQCRAILARLADIVDIEILVKDQPTVDAVEVVHGCNVYDHDSSFECSVCGWGDYDTLTADTAKYNYCPNCGAKMDGDGNA